MTGAKILTQHFAREAILRFLKEQDGRVDRADAKRKILEACAAPDDPSNAVGFAALSLSREQLIEEQKKSTQADRDYYVLTDKGRKRFLG